MGTIGQAFVAAFYGVMGLSLVYFVHKVWWFLRFRQLLRRLVVGALERLGEEAETSVVRFEQGADASWTELAGPTHAGPVAYVTRVERRLRAMRRELAEGRGEAGDALVAALDPHATAEFQRYVRVLRVPSVEGEPRDIEVDLAFPHVRGAEPPDGTVFRLEVRSRYGVVPRLLSFVLGAADVVYGSRHVARISQHANVPFVVLLRRLSLVAVVLFAVGVDLALSIRPRLVAWANAKVEAGLEAPIGGAFGAWVNDNLGPIVGAQPCGSWRTARCTA